MAGGRSRCLSCLLAYTAALLLGVSRHDVEAAEGKQVIHKRVGDSVELSSNSPAEGVNRADWKYQNSIVATKGPGLIANNPFHGRAEFNNTSLTLTIRDLTLQDSGEFSFNFIKDGQQSIVITLQVHEPISTNSVVFSNITEAASNGFCTVSLECKANPHSNVAYSWTVGTQTRNGSRLQYNITPQDGATKFTCHASNVVSEKLASETLRCSNSSTESGFNKEIQFLVWIITAAVGGLLVIVIIIVVSACLCKRRWSGSDSNELTVYADISDFLSEVGPSDKPCSLYDTIDNRNSPDHQMPQTIYDKIQIERMRKASVSPYQEVS